MKLIKDSANVSTIEGSNIKVVDLEENGNYYALMSMLTGHLGLSYGIIQRAATKLGCYKDVRDAFCVPLHMLHALSCELRRRYPKKAGVVELWSATLPEPTDTTLSTSEPLTQAASLDEGSRRSSLEPSAPSEDETPLADQDFYTVLPTQLKEWTFDAMKNSDAEGITWLYRMVDDEDNASLGELWGNYVYELHKLDELYPKLRYRLSVIGAHRAKPLGKLKLLQV